MKPSRRYLPFQFHSSHQEIVDKINTDLPISLKYNQELIERIYQKYPLINKSEVAIIVKAVFGSIRDLLILGKILNFNNLFFDAQLFFFKHCRGERILPSLKVRLSTPPALRNYGK